MYLASRVKDYDIGLGKDRTFLGEVSPIRTKFLPQPGSIVARSGFLAAQPNEPAKNPMKTLLRKLKNLDR